MNNCDSFCVNNDKNISHKNIKVPMKQNFVQLFFLLHCKDHFNVTSTLFDMQITQLMTLLCIMSIFEIVDFVAFGNKKELKLWCTCVNYH